MRLFADNLVRLGLAALVVMLAVPAWTAPASRPSTATDIWVTTWESSPEMPRAPAIVLAGQTVRQVARVSLGGIYIRARLSNEFGDRPLVIGAAHLALGAGGGSTIDPSSDRTITFSGQPTVTIPPGAAVLSDPVSLTVPSLSNVVVSLYFPQPTGAVTENFFSMQTTYMAPGDQTAAGTLPGAATVTRRLILTALDISAATSARTVVVFGDSLTSGFGSTVDANHRWPDFLAEKLVNRSGRPALSVVNAGIGGNRLLHDFFGPNALARFDRDVLASPASAT